jgi:6-phosphogluconolactonase
MNPTRTARGDVWVYDDAEAVARAAADTFVAIVAGVLADRALARVALAGGSTPKAMYRLLASPAYRERVEWSRVEIFFGDERCVPPDHVDSNYRMARESLLDHVPLGADRVHRICGERPPEEAAAQYQQKVVRDAALDLVLLGMGPDGHTASLFPGSPGLGETQRFVIANQVTSPLVHGTATRITLTFPAIAAARHTRFLVAGADKAETLAGVLEGPAGRYPSQRVTGADVAWLVDTAAAARLKGVPT